MAPREPPTSSSSRGRIPPVSMQVLTPTRILPATKPTQPTKMSLPIELLEQIVDYMSVPTQLCFARTSHAMRDMVYDDSRWTARLKDMGVWNEEDARRVAEEEIFMQREEAMRARQEAVLGRTLTNGGGGSTTLFDAGVVEKRKGSVNAGKGTDDLLDFQGDKTDDFGEFQSVDVAVVEKPVEAVSPLNVLFSVVSRRGKARVEFGRVYATLAPLYISLANSDSLEEAAVFRHRRQPEEQAKLLKVLELFGRSRSVGDWTRCQKRIAWITETFERHMLTEFEQGYEAQDIEGKMHKYAHILHELNAGQSCIEMFIRKHQSIFNYKENPMKCLTPLGLNLDPMQEYIYQLLAHLDGQTRIADKVFPSPTKAMTMFTKQVLDLVLMDYSTTLIDRTRHGAETEVYLKAVVGTYHQCVRLVQYLNKPSDATSSFRISLISHVNSLFEPHVEPYLRVELDHYKKSCDTVVESWKKKIEDEDFQSGMRGNVIRENDKSNFLASFKKVILLPVSVLPNLPFPGTHSHSRSSTAIGKTSTPNQSGTPARPSTPSGWEDTPTPPSSLANNPQPATELAAQTAILNSRLERIKTLFSIEVALQLIHTGKETLERIKSFRRFPGEIGEKVRQGCETAFVTLLIALGQNHIQPGFEQALEHLSERKPYEESEGDEAVGPLLTFLELVHIGDLIQQMVDVFFNQEVAGMIDRTDFLNPVVKEKKNFEQKTIDVWVAAGLNKGIDVLIEHVEYIFSTKQLASDYCPPPVAVTGVLNADLSPTSAATAAVKCLKTHTKLLQGSTDKGILDVFFQEVGLRFFGAICKHIKTLKINNEGAIRLISYSPSPSILSNSSDFNLYHTYASSLRQIRIMPYFTALKEVGHIFIIEEGQGKAVGSVVTDVIRFEGIFRPEEVYEFVQCRVDWAQIKRDVERALFGLGRDDCLVM